MGLPTVDPSAVAEDGINEMEIEEKDLFVLEGILQKAVYQGARYQLEMTMGGNVRQVTDGEMYRVRNLITSKCVMLRSKEWASRHPSQSQIIQPGPMSEEDIAILVAGGGYD